MFAVMQVSVTDKTVVFFWGLAATANAPTWGCPVGLYRSGSNYIIWNKVRVVF